MPERHRLEGAAALADHAVYEPCGERGRLQQGHAQGAGGLAEDRHVARIAAELRDVVTHPCEGRDLVPDPLVPGDAPRALGAEFGKRQEPEGSESVVRRNQHDALRGQQFTGIVRAGPGDEGAAVDPDHHREPLADMPGPGPHVEGQAVLAHLEGGLAVEAVAESVRLHALRARRGRVTDIAPRLDRRRRRPAPVIDRWGGERDAVVLLQAVLSDCSADRPARHGDLGTDDDRRRRLGGLGRAASGGQPENREYRQRAYEHDLIPDRIREGVMLKRNGRGSVHRRTIPLCM